MTIRSKFMWYLVLAPPNVRPDAPTPLGTAPGGRKGEH